MKKICVLGLGYIGLPTASILATRGFKVIGVDVNPDVVKMLNRGRVHIVEPDLDTVLSASIRSGHLKAQLKPEAADVFMICVPTPIHPKTKSADLTFVRKAAEAITPYLRRGNLVVVESTIPPAATEETVIPILKKSGLKIGTQLFVAHCPERVLPGKILTEMVQNHRVIGGINPASAELARNVYASFVKGDIFLTDLKTAELVKLLENSYRDVNIAFANEVSLLCEKEGVSPWRVIELANKHPRVKILNPGPGVGGHCIAVDPWFLVERYPAEARLIRRAREVNDHRPAQVVQHVLQVARSKKKPVICCLGLTYKANVDDIRESPAMEVYHLLSKEPGVKTIACDPYVPAFGGHSLPSWKTALPKADIVVLLVDHEEFQQIPPALLKSKTLVDTRGFWKAQSKK